VAVEKDERYETDTARLQATISTLELSVAGYRTENEQLVEKVAQMPTLFQRLEGLEAEVLRLERERTVRQKQHAASVLELKQQLSDEQGARRDDAAKHARKVLQIEKELGDQIAAIEVQLLQASEAHAKDITKFEAAEAEMTSKMHSMQQEIDAMSRMASEKAEELRVCIEVHAQQLGEVQTELEHQKDKCAQLEGELAEAVARAQLSQAAQQTAERALEELRTTHDNMLQRRTAWQNYEVYGKEKNCSINRSIN